MPAAERRERVGFRLVCCAWAALLLFHYAVSPAIKREHRLLLELEKKTKERRESCFKGSRRLGGYKRDMVELEQLLPQRIIEGEKGAEVFISESLSACGVSALIKESGRDGENLTLSVEGECDYSSLVKILSDLRESPAAARVNRLSMAGEGG